MPTATISYGAISPETAGYVSKEFLDRAAAELVSEQFCQTKPLPSRSTMLMVFRRYNALDITPNVLVEGVTPDGKSYTKTDIPCRLQQVGDWVPLTDVIADTHTDPMLQEVTEMLSEQAPAMLEMMRLGVMKGGTAVFYANGLLRTAVNTKITRALVRRIVRALDRQYAKPITKRVKSTADYGTESVAAAYVCLCHTDCEGDVRDLEGFVPVEDYAAAGPTYVTEIGKCERVRFVAAPLLKPFADAGDDTTTMISTTGAKADVYPYLFLGANAVATVPFKGANAVTPSVLNPGVPREGDPLGQRGTAGWKTYTGTAILNDAWMARLEAGVTQ